MGLDQKFTEQAASAEQVTSTARYRIDTRFSEYISQASPQMRPLLRDLRDDVMNDLEWLALRYDGVELPIERSFSQAVSARTEAD